MGNVTTQGRRDRQISKLLLLEEVISDRLD